MVRLIFDEPYLLYNVKKYIVIEQTNLPTVEYHGIIVKHAVSTESEDNWQKKYKNFSLDNQKIIKASGIDSREYEVCFDYKGRGTVGYAIGKANAELLLEAMSEYAPHDKFRISLLRGFKKWNIAGLLALPHIIKTYHDRDFYDARCIACGGYETKKKSDGSRSSFGLVPFTSDCTGFKVDNWSSMLIRDGIIDYLDTKWVKLKAVENPMDDSHGIARKEIEKHFKEKSKNHNI